MTLAWRMVRCRCFASCAMRDTEIEEGAGRAFARVRRAVGQADRILESPNVVVPPADPISDAASLASSIVDSERRVAAVPPALLMAASAARHPLTPPADRRRWDVAAAVSLEAPSPRHAQLLRRALVVASRHPAQFPLIARMSAVWDDGCVPLRDAGPIHGQVVGAFGVQAAPDRWGPRPPAMPCDVDPGAWRQLASEAHVLPRQLEAPLSHSFATTEGSHGSPNGRHGGLPAGSPSASGDSRRRDQASMDVPAESVRHPGCCASTLACVTCGCCSAAAPTTSTRGVGGGWLSCLRIYTGTVAGHLAMLLGLLGIVCVVAGLSALGRLEHHGACQEAVSAAVRRGAGTAVAKAWEVLVRAPLPLLNAFLLGVPSLLLAVQVWLLLLAVQAMARSCWSPIVSAPRAASRAMSWSAAYALFAVILLPAVVHAVAVALGVWVLSDDFDKANSGTDSSHGRQPFVLPASVLLSGAGGAVFTAFLLHRGLLGGALELLRPFEAVSRAVRTCCAASHADVVQARRRSMPDWPSAHAEVIALAAAALLPALVCPAVAIAGALGLWAKHATETHTLLYQCREEAARRLETQGDWAVGDGRARARLPLGPAGRGEGFGTSQDPLRVYRSPSVGIQLTATASTWLGAVAVMFHLVLLALAAFHGRLSQAAVAGGCLVVALVASLGARVGVVGSLWGGAGGVGVGVGDVDAGVVVPGEQSGGHVQMMQDGSAQGRGQAETGGSDGEESGLGSGMEGDSEAEEAASAAERFGEQPGKVRGTGLSLLGGLAAFLRGEPTEPMFGPDGYARKGVPYASEPEKVEAEAVA